MENYSKHIMNVAHRYLADKDLKSVDLVDRIREFFGDFKDNVEDFAKREISKRQIIEVERLRNDITELKQIYSDYFESHDRSRFIVQNRERVDILEKRVRGTLAFYCPNTRQIQTTVEEYAFKDWYHKYMIPKHNEWQQDDFTGNNHGIIIPPYNEFHGK